MLKILNIVFLLHTFTSATQLSADGRGHFGLQTSFATASGQATAGMTKNNFWVGGIFWNVHLSPKVDLTFKLEAGALPKIKREYKTKSGLGYIRDSQGLTGGTVGANIILRPWGHANRPFFIAGLARYSWSKYGGGSAGAVHFPEDHDPSYERGARINNSSGWEPSLGIGYQIGQHVSLQSQYTFSKLDSSEGKEKLGIFKLTLGYIF